MDSASRHSEFLADALRFLLHDSSSPASTHATSAAPLPNVFHLATLPWHTALPNQPRVVSTTTPDTNVKQELDRESSEDPISTTIRARRSRQSRQSGRPPNTPTNSETEPPVRREDASDSDESLPSLARLGIRCHSPILSESGDDVIHKATPCPSKRRGPLDKQIQRVRKHALQPVPPVRRKLFGRNASPRPTRTFSQRRQSRQSRQSPQVIVTKSKTTTTVSSGVNIQFFSKSHLTWVSEPSLLKQMEVDTLSRPRPTSTRPVLSRRASDSSTTALLNPGSSPRLVEPKPSRLHSLPYNKGSRILHKWSSKQKIVLCVLRRWYENSWADAAEVFNYFFRGDLTYCGEEVHRPSAMATYWADLRTGRRLDSAWDAIYVNTPFHDPLGQWTDLRAKLECAGQLVGVNLQQRQEDNMWEPTPKRPRSNDQSNLANGRGHKSSDSDGSEDDDLWALDREPQGSITKQSAALKPQERGPASQIAPITPQTSSSQLSTTPDSLFSSQFSQEVMPQLFYRKYDNLSAGYNSPQGFVAGQYHRLNGIEVPPPMPTDSPWFPHQATNHLTRMPVATPFISVTGSFIWVVYQALRSERSSNASIALIDSIAAARNGRAYHVQPIMSSLKRMGFIRGIRYKATQEWWIWAEIKAEAILHVASLADLADDPEISQLLILDELRSSNNLTSFRNRLQHNPRNLSIDICAALGRVVALFTLDPRRHKDFITQLVRDIMSGWFILSVEDPNTPSSHSTTAQAFIDAFKSSTDHDRSFWDGEEEALYRAFVHGLDLAAATMEKERAYFKRTAGLKRRSEEGHGGRSRQRMTRKDEVELE